MVKAERLKSLNKVGDSETGKYVTGVGHCEE